MIESPRCKGAMKRRFQGYSIVGKVHCVNVTPKRRAAEFLTRSIGSSRRVIPIATTSGPIATTSGPNAPDY